ncbi:MAG: hypothetical protein IJC42_04395, partial [Oscillospiraceae bacterium]|nr:hypothetical protein [Oscillospiraceae bacterium]
AYIFATIVALVVSVMTLASFIKVTQAVFFGQLPDKLKDTKEVPFAMRLPMWIMSGLCILSGVFYRFVDVNVLYPVRNAAFGVKNYISSMLGGEAAAAASNVSSEEFFTLWDPKLWLILFAIVLLAVCIVVLLGDKTLGAVRKNKASEESDGKYATFFGGEKSTHSHVAGSDLFWGFKKDFKGYFKFMQGMHSGSVNDYALYVVVGTALIVATMFIFVL